MFLLCHLKYRITVDGRNLWKKYGKHFLMKAHSGLRDNTPVIADFNQSTLHSFRYSVQLGHTKGIADHHS